MKRKLLAYLCMAVMAVSLVGCGSAEISSGSNNDKTTSDEDIFDTYETDEDETTTAKNKTTEKETTTAKNKNTEKETTTDEDETTTKKQSSADTSNWTKYTGTGYSISAPGTWIEYNYESSDLTLANSLTSSDDFAENITVVLQDTSRYNLDLEGYKDLSLSQYESLKYTVISTEKGSINGVEGYYLVCTTETNGILCYCSQFFTVIDDTAYVFTFAADSEGYSELADEVLDIYSTITFN